MKQKNIQRSLDSEVSTVGTARNFIALFNGTIIYDDAAICLLNGIYRQGNSALQNKNSSDILIIPNPADDKIEVVLQSKYEGICQIEILNYLGEIIQAEKINCNESRKTINTKTFAPGVYTIKIKPKDSAIKIAKLIIQR